MRFFVAAAPQNGRWDFLNVALAHAASAGAGVHIGPSARFSACRFFGLRRGYALRGPLLSARAERRGRKARQREGLFTKPPFPLESHPPKFAFPPRLTDAVHAASLCSARAITVRRGMSEEGLHRESACGYAETTLFVTLSAAKNPNRAPRARLSSGLRKFVFRVRKRFVKRNAARKISI